MEKSILALEDGTVFEGRSFGAPTTTSGEVVFNTSITGYQEIFTDPSYSGQIVVLTNPQIGNYGANPDDSESVRPFIEGLVVRDFSPLASNWRSEEGACQFLSRNGLPVASDIDTRALVRRLRTRGVMRGVLSGNGGDPVKLVEQARAIPSMSGLDLATRVSTLEQYKWSEGVSPVSESDLTGDPAAPRFHVVAYDFGIKRSILRMLADRGCKVTVVPAETPAAEVLAMELDGVFLSNGPGDPAPCVYAIAAIRELIATKIPMFGICLGHQLLALASGAQTLKMKFGHHGANHPVQDIGSGRVMITSQNHGFAVNEDSLPVNVRVTHRSLFDGSNQGIALTDAPAFSFQGHPEAAPGPHDVSPLFDRFVALMVKD